MESHDRHLGADSLTAVESAHRQPTRRKIARDMSHLSQTFFELTARLQDQFEIDKGVLVLRQEEPRQLAAVSTWSGGLGRDGLAVNLPPEASLFEKVAEQGRPYTENFCEAFSGNFFERKLLLEDDSRSFVVLPLKCQGRVVGLLAYSSHSPTAFTLFEEDILGEIADQLGTAIAADRHP